jgi:hypothetical protein
MTVGRDLKKASERFIDRIRNSDIKMDTFPNHGNDFFRGYSKNHMYRFSKYLTSCSRIIDQKHMRKI